MNKAQKRLVSALAAATSVAAAIAPAATVFAATKDEAKALLDNAKKTLAFVDYNQAYAAIVALPAADQPALLAELTPLWGKVATKDVTDVLKTMESLAKNKDLKNYYDLYTMIEKTVSLPRNQQYLMGELTSWGKAAVFTPDIVAATDAVIKAYTDKTPAAIQAAKDLAAKVTNAGSLAWLNTEIANASKAVPVAVSSVTAKTASTFVVKFSVPVADTSKVAFTVKNYTTPVTVTATWNADKTEATLTNSANFAEGTYTVAVKNDTTDLGTSTVAVAAQKVAKIEITSNKLAVANVTENNAQKQYGYATYKVYDQYGNDITTSYLANNIIFQTGVGTVAKDKGVLKVTPGTNINLMSFTSGVVITGYDSTNGITTSATLATTSTLGTLNGIELKGIKNGATITAGDDTVVYYIDYSAVDMSDNATTDYKLVSQGLLLQGTNKDELTVSAPSYVTAKIVQDPADSNKAAIEVKATNQEITMDLPISITAMTFTGKTSTLNLTLKKQSTVDTFTLMAPAQDIAINETKEIPFVAYDQNGKQITKYTDLLKANISFSSNKVNLVENSDGTARLEVGSWGTDGPQIITAVTSTGKMSSLTLNIQKVATADSLTVDASKVTYLQANGVQKYDFYDAGGLTVKDQYGRAVDMKTAARNGYKVVATTSSSNVSLYTISKTNGATTGAITTNDTTKAEAFVGKKQIAIKGLTQGSATVVFKLVDAAGTELSSKSVTFTVVDNDDITGYVLDAVPTVYAASPATATTSGALTARQVEYKAEPDLYGTLSNGTKVMLGGSMITGVFVDNTKDFIVDANNQALSASNPGAYDSISVYAKDLDNNRTSATTTLTVTVKGTDGKVKTVTAPITSSTTKPAATEMQIKVMNEWVGTDGKSIVSVDGETIKVKRTAQALTDLNLVTGAYMQTYLPEDTKNRAGIYFRAKDQYGETSWKLSYVGVAGYSTGINANGFNVDSEGKLTVDINNIAANSYVYVTGVSSNGLTKTVKIVFVDKFDWEN